MAKNSAWAIERYRLPPETKRGMVVRSLHDDKQGVITSFRNGYVMVKMEGQVKAYHPLDLVYGDESVDTAIRRCVRFDELVEAFMKMMKG